jgi:hypothetical protein
MLLLLGLRTAAAGVSGEISQMFNARWNFDMDGTNDFLTYHNDPATFTKFSGSFCNQATGLALGANVDVNTDNNAVARAKYVMGYLGYREIYLRYQRGALNGTYHWSGAVTPDMSRDGQFEQNVTHVDLLFWKNKVLGAPGFIGFGYTSLGLPVEVQTLFTGSDKAHQRNGTFVYDPDYKVNFYSFLFGFDTFGTPLVSAKSGVSGRGGFGFFISGEDRIGFGTSEMGKEAVANAKALNPGLKPVTESFVAAIIENDTSLGIRWFSPGGNVGIGLGYEISFISNFNFSGAAEKPGDLGFDIYASLLRYGPIARLLVQW